MRNNGRMDFANGNEHILVYDLMSGEVIDFYSALNVFYASGSEELPVITFY